MSEQTAATKFVESVLAQTEVKPRSESSVPWCALARFQLDPRNNPYFDDVAGVHHYWIDLSVESAQLDQITWAEYRVYVPTRSELRFSDERKTNFTDVVRVAGDCEVRVRVGMNGHRFEDHVKLSAILEAGHATDMTPAIRDAINRMKAN